jgi:hypothetical protein
MSWLTTLLAHSCLPGCTRSFLAPSPLPLPYPHPLPLPLPPHRHLVAPWPPMPLLWLVVASPCHLHHSVNVCSCIIIVCIVARHLGGGVIVCVVVHQLRCCLSSASRCRRPSSVLRRHCVRHPQLSASRQRRLRLHCCCCCRLHRGSIVCIVICIVVCGVVVCVVVICAIVICMAGVVGSWCCCEHRRPLSALRRHLLQLRRLRHHLWRCRLHHPCLRHCRLHCWGGGVAALLCASSSVVCIAAALSAAVLSSLSASQRHCFNHRLRCPLQRCCLC